MQATEIDFSAPRDAVIDGDHSTSIDAPWNIVLGFAGGDAAVAFDAAFCVADEFHLCHFDGPL